MPTTTRTHLSPTTGKRERCTASVRACRFDDHETLNPGVPSMAEFYAEVPAAAYASITHPVIHRALTADLSHSGPKPTWWKKHEAEASSHPELPSRTALLDVIDTPAGKVAVVWQEISHRDKDTGMIADSGMTVQTYNYLDFNSGENLGYVNLSNRDARSFTRSFGSDEFANFRYHQRFTGSILGLKGREAFKSGDRGPGFHNLQGDALVEKRREVWLKMRRRSDRGPIPSGYNLPDGTWVSPYHIDEEHLPDDETVARELREMSALLDVGVKADMKHFATPFVDFSRVEGPLGGKGYGSTLYIYAARHLAGRGLALRGSGIQSDSAQDLWQRFRQTIPQHVKSMKLRYKQGKPQDYPTLDFR